MTPASLALRAYIAATRALQPLAPTLLKRRLARGKELPDRWREKLGEPSLPRPAGRLVWLHAVGLGETLALRGLIARMSEDRPDQAYLVTSGTRASAEVLSQNLPPRTRHQFLPLDTPGYAKRFLDHWQPDLAIWAEQEVWPGLVYQTDTRGTPLAMVNARLDEAAFSARRKARAIYADTLGRFQLISAQDTGSATRLEDLGAWNVRVDGSLKPAAPPLSASPEELHRIDSVSNGRRIFLAASTHPEDEAVLRGVLPKLPSDWLAVIVPRLPERAPDLLAQGFARFTEAEPAQTGSVLLDDRFGTLGAWYRKADAALIGGSFGPVEGHNPWEAAALGAAILHGPRTANFRADYEAFNAAGASFPVSDAQDILTALDAPDKAERVAAATALVAEQTDRIAALARDLNAL